jgi:hypothetical protein
MHGLSSSGIDDTDTGDAQKQQISGELWGTGPTILAARAYRGPLPPHERGIEFTTSIPPTAGGTPVEANWIPCVPSIPPPCTPQVQVKNNGGTDFAVISISVTKNTQVP